LIKVGYKASAEQFGPAELLRFAIVADEVGFDSVFVSDHFQPWRHTHGHAPSSIAWLGAAGARTSRVTLGTSVLTPTFRYHPSIVAQAFATLGVLFPGRIVLGVGTGESLNEVPATDLRWPEAKERFARLREAVELIRALWAAERVSFEGSYYHTRNATIYDRPSAPVPIYVAAGGPMVAKYAGRAGDGFICTSGKGDALYSDQLLPNVAAGLEGSGRPQREFERVIEMKVSFDTDRTAALDATRHWAALALSAEEKTSVEDPLALEKLADALPLERAAQRFIVSDDAEEHVERILRYARLGFTHLVFHAPGPDQERFLRLYAQHILPRLRRACN
jgi:coenzyme F420-dependent glucose-6-phosphate dehydrogenase